MWWKSIGFKRERHQNRDAKSHCKKLRKTSPQFKTMRGRIKANYDDGSEQQNINVSYRFQKEETLWMSAKFAGLIQVAKMMISQNNIKFYERIDNSYFDGDFKLISSFLGLKLNYNQIENMFVGQAIMPIDILKTDFQTAENFYQLVTTYKSGLTQFLLLDSKTFKIKQQVLSLEDKQLKIVYNSYQMIDGLSFPEEFVILAGNQNEQISIVLTYKNIKLNDDLKFPFNFPNNYTPINLN